MRRIIFTGIIMVLVTFSTAGAQDIGYSKGSDLSEISRIRKQVRSACAQIKKSSTHPVSTEFMRDASAEAERALVLWKQFVAASRDQAPPAYRNHPDWNRAVKKIEESLVDMRNETDAKKALAACGQTCRQFVELNQKARIETAADTLYQFRKKAKPLLASVKGKDLETIVASADSLSELRTRALNLAASDKTKEGLAVSELNQFSESLDVFISAARSGDEKAINSRYLSMMSTMESAYDQLL